MNRNFIKILQFSDLHFDTPFLALSSEESELRKEELRETFSRIIDVSKERAADIILIAGDLFDNRRVSKVTIDFIIEKFKSIPEMYIFIAPGNHDPNRDKSFYKIIKWPKNVYVFESKMERIYIDNLKTYIYGIGFYKEHIEESLLSNFKPCEDNGFFNIMVLHGDVVGEGGKSLYNPIYLNDIKNSNLDYIAIGHKHSYSFNKISNTYYCYSGNPEGRSFNEGGEKGVVFSELYKGFCKSEFIPTCKRKYITYKIDISECNNYEKIKNKILYDIDEESRKKDIIRVVLSGYISKYFIVNLTLLKKKIQIYFHYIDFIDETKINLLENDFITGSLRDIYFKSLKEKIEQADYDDEKEILKEALILGLKALQDEEV